MTQLYVKFYLAAPAAGTYSRCWDAPGIGSGSGPRFKVGIYDFFLQIFLFFFFQAEDGIRDTSVTGVQTCALPICLKELTGLENLTALLLEDTPVSDAGLRELAPLRKLATLYLQRTKVTDAGLKE